MKIFEFEKCQIDDKWFLVCTSHKHFPMIEYLKTGNYKVSDCNGVPRIEETFDDAMKFAKQTYKKMKKLNKDFKE